MSGKISKMFYYSSACVCAKSLQLCLTLFDPMDCSPPDSSVYGILQERWSGLPCPPPEGLPDLGIESRSLTLQEDSLLSEPPGKPSAWAPGRWGLPQPQEPTRDGAPASGPASSPPAAQPSSKNSDNKRTRVSSAPHPRAGPSAGAAMLSCEPCDLVGHVSPPSLKGPSPRLT